MGTADLLIWLAEVLAAPEAAYRLGVKALTTAKNRLVLKAATLCGFLFLCRASEYLRGAQLACHRGAGDYLRARRRGAS